MAAHRYWSLFNIITTNGTTLFGLASLEAYEVSGGTDLAPSATASIENDTVRDGSLADMFDGNTMTRCQFFNAISQRIVLDFGSGNDKDIIEWKIATNSDAADRGPGSFMFMYSDDGTNWTPTLFCRMLATDYTIGTLYTFAPPADATARYWNLFDIKSSGGLSIAEIEFRTSPGGSNTISGGTPLGYENPYGGYEQDKACDSNPATAWATNGAANPSYWWQYDYGSGNDIAIVEATVQTRAGFPTQAPTSFRVGFSDDGHSWGIAGSFSGLSWTDGEIKVFTLSAPVTPSVTSVSPDSGVVTGGTSVILTGTLLTGTTDVQFDGNSATSIVVVSSTTITCDTPAGTAGVVDIDIFNPAGDFNFPASYTYLEASLTSVSPNSGGIAGGDPVTITGEFLTGATDVQFDGDSATSIVVVDDETITCDTPAHAVGLIDVQVFTPAGDPILTDGYTFSDTPAPRITQVPILTLDISPQPTRVTQVPILILYQEEQPNRITQVPVHVLYTPKDVKMPLPVIPEVPVTEIWQWKTALNASHVGQEQRSRLRNTPRYKLGINALILDEADRVRVYNILMRYLKVPFPYPLFQYSTELTAATLAGNIQINCDLTKTDIRAGEQVALFDPFLTEVHYFTVLSLGTGFFFVNAALPINIPANWQVCPVLTFRITPVVGFNMRNIDGDFSVTMESTLPRVFQRPGAAPTLTTIDGITIITDRHLANDDISETFNHGATWYDNGQSIPEILNEWSNPHIESNRKYSFNRKAGMDYWRAIGDLLKGRQGVALFPTFRNDLALREPMALGAKTFTTDNVNFYKWWLDVNFSYVAIYTANGPIYRRVVDVAPHYDAEGYPDYMTVKLRDAIGGSAGDNDIKAISYMNLCRLDTDEIKLTHSELDTVIEFDIKAVDK